MSRNSQPRRLSSAIRPWCGVGTNGAAAWSCKGSRIRGTSRCAGIQKQVPQFTLITQNVDDLHERAGSTDVLHLHGELSKPYCESCRKPYSRPGGIPDAQIAGGRLPPPRCLDCGASIRPGVVWFGESLPQSQWGAAREATEYCDFFICCGTSALVQPAASLTTIAINAGATTVQINPNPTSLDSEMTFSIRGPSGIVLPQLVAATWPPE
jgi:NAD-dependent deacetylase